MKAQFIGSNSLGYVSGEVYEIKTYIEGKYLWIKDENNKCKRCAYTNVEALLNNWNILNTNENEHFSDLSWDDF